MRKRQRHLIGVLRVRTGPSCPSAQVGRRATRTTWWARLIASIATAIQGRVGGLFMPDGPDHLAF